MIIDNYSLDVHAGMMFLVLPIPEWSVPSFFEDSTGKWEVKKNFHVTMVGAQHKLIDYVSKTRGVSKAHAERFIWEMIAISRRGIKFGIEMLPEIRRVTKLYSEPRAHVRETIIRMCKVHGSEEFYERLSQNVGVAIKDVPHHITLYTRGDPQSKQGIGLISQAELEACTVIYQEPLIAKVLLI